ncbi:hypothetical protein [Oceanobacillus jeddahense]|uniref:hypothetical protein n=1 Tax=Oceanobacillus jeddahense TaxID=1462527 RepID=UPI0005963A49|nr:hypothetical protein [Oceanobacillus jeddahense]
MTDLEGVFKVLKQLNKKYDNKLISSGELKEETANIKELPQIKEKLIKTLDNLSQLDDRKEIKSELIQLHLIVGEMEWQIDQLHEIIRNTIEEI